MKSTYYYNSSTKITFEDILRHALDQQTGGHPINALDLAYTNQRVNNAMLSLIKRRGLLNDLLVDLGLCSLCQTHKNQRRMAR